MSDDQKTPEVLRNQAGEEISGQDEVPTESPKSPEVKLSDLQAEAVKLGMTKEDALKFRQKGPLEVMLKTLRNKPAVEPDVQDTKRVISIIEKPNIREEKMIEKQYRTKALIMREKLEKQKKYSYFIPLVGEEKPGVVREVTIRGRKELLHVSGAIITPQYNGFKMIIPKGVQVMIPEQVFEELNKSREQTSNAGAEFLIDRKDEKTGGRVSDRLQ